MWERFLEVLGSVLKIIKLVISSIELELNWKLEGVVFWIYGDKWSYLGSLIK